jgi:hypothetical protein
MEFFRQLINAQEEIIRKLVQDQKDIYNEQLAIFEYQQQQFRRGVSVEDVVPRQVVTESDLRIMTFDHNQILLTVKTSHVQILSQYLYEYRDNGARIIDLPSPPNPSAPEE